MHHGRRPGDRLLRLAPDPVRFVLGLLVLRDRAQVAARRVRLVAPPHCALRVLEHGLGEQQRWHVVLHRAGAVRSVAGGQRRITFCSEGWIESRRQRIGEQLVDAGRGIGSQWRRDG